MYETNVLGSKGPRKMKVLLPLVSREKKMYSWKETDKDSGMSEMFKANNTENIMFLYNKPPKWNECKHFSLNWGRGASIRAQFQRTGGQGVR